MYVPVVICYPYAYYPKLIILGRHFTARPRQYNFLIVGYPMKKGTSAQASKKLFFILQAKFLGRTYENLCGGLYFFLLVSNL